MQGSALDVKERIREAVDIVDLVGSYLQLRREGRGYKALCPWHDDSRPACRSIPSGNRSSAGSATSAATFSVSSCRSRGSTFPEALAMLAERAGITLDKQPSGGPADSTKADAVSGHGLGRRAQYHRLLLERSAGRGGPAYLAERPITPESIDAFRLGYAPDRVGLARARRPAARLSRPRCWKRPASSARRQTGGGHYDWFRNRCCFRSSTPQGRPSASAGRVLPGSDGGKGGQVSSTRPRRRCSPRAICSTACTWPASDPQNAAPRWSWKAIPTSSSPISAASRTRWPCWARPWARSRSALLQAICRSAADRAGARWRRGRPATGERSAGVVRGRECRRARADLARRARPLPSFCWSAGPRRLRPLIDRAAELRWTHAVQRT